LTKERLRRLNAIKTSIIFKVGILECPIVIEIRISGRLGSGI
jgi:hypothetical protein